MTAQAVSGPEWTAVSSRGRDRGPVAAASLVICKPRLHRAIRGAQGVLPMMVGDATSQLDLPFLAPLSVAGCGQLQLGVPQWATSVEYCK